MTERGRYTMELILRDNQSSEVLRMARDLRPSEADTVIIPARAVEEMKAGFGTFETTVDLMRRKQFRKDNFKAAATLLGAALAERMEDAEGWHDTSRVEPARKELTGGQPFRPWRW